ncbi:MAG: DegT/DnrJ/EryC1/StrS aminotransferase family protein [Candidatus Pacebacteria bacterium]|nr:DegT/DnrJ/EryC1/StrS aminotransferase family protein [Candidatus Paceibacterota bacterium]
MNKKKFIVFGKPSLDKEEIRAITEVLKSGWIGMGPKCEEFEKLFAEYVGAKYAVSVSSCTAALHLALLAAGVEPGDEVITTPLTFVATINAIEYCGAKPVLADIDPKSLNINPEFIRKAITKKTKAILPVHFGGLPCDMDSINAIAQEKGLAVIEDAAHAVGAEWRGVRIGGLKNSIACFSFYPNKNMTSIEGGMVTTDNAEIAEKIKIMRVHGMDNEAWKRYQGGKKLIHSEMVMPGFKYNLTDAQAAIGICQLKKLDKFQDKREEYAEIYDDYFSDVCDTQVGLSMDTDSAEFRIRHALHLYLILLKTEKMRKGREEILQEIRDEGIGATIHYLPVHMHRYYREKFGFKKGDFPVAEDAYQRMITLPLTPSMTLKDAKRVAETVKCIIVTNMK